MNRIQLQRNTIYRYNLYDEISDFEDYENFITDLAQMSENDTVALYINSPGGRLDIGTSLVRSIQQSRASTTAIIEGSSYSMASIIALSCSQLLMFSNTYLMFHNYSSVLMGKGQEMMTVARHEDESFQKLMVEICKPFLTKREINRIRKDQDFYIWDDDPSLEKRKERHFK